MLRGRVYGVRRRRARAAYSSAETANIVMGTASTRAVGEAAYQCTPFMMFAIAICSMLAFSAAAGSLSPLDAAESGKTL